MNKKVAASWVSLAVVLSFIVIIIEIVPVVEAPITWCVDDVPGNGAPGNPPEDFTSIQDAINASSDGDTVFVYNGTYYENVVVNKTINLTGENRDDTIINGSWKWDVIKITADLVNVTGFTVKGSGNDMKDSGIELSRVNNCRITNNNVLSNNGTGIYINGSYNNNIMDNNIFSNAIYGIYLFPFDFVPDSDDNIISGNNISLNKRDGIHLNGSNGTIITNNNISSNNGNGIYLNFSFNNAISDNIVLNNRNGIRLENQDVSLLHNNFLFENLVGISILYSVEISIINNYVSYNNDSGIFLSLSAENNIIGNNISNNGLGINIQDSLLVSIYHNNIIGNTNQARENITGPFNQWDNGYPSGGNFWSDYTGIDQFSGPDQDIPGNDGIGDTNYSIESYSVDNYPLMAPIGNCIFLYEGWNLISIPFIQSDTNIETVLSSISGAYDAVQWYNGSNFSDHWKHYHSSKPPYMNDLNNIDHTMGFWIHITSPGGVLFVYEGVQPTKNQTITLHPGWNQVGHPSLTSYNRTEGLNNLTFDTHVDSIWTYNAATQKWKDLGPTDNFEIGKGYWVHTKTKCEWEVPL
jgi:parallel beta-helix repeat protein